MPIPLIERVEVYIKEHPELGYTSVPEFVRQAIREKLGEK